MVSLLPAVFQYIISAAVFKIILSAVINNILPVSKIISFDRYSKKQKLKKSPE